ncbi:dephospho-CoA kinase [Chelativorans sp. YIM 93263]|uniref:dephospho-CoA kinase n=1 Tax=Chelativorans sp. YIM 93263 TaxID=2906648 RepID=UPI0023787085|nr:dephospho-CoA kinase [Chelativorans sp. YIM 93263]
MIVLGLTGSIAMGKSTTARMFEEEGVPVHDSDSAVHRLYAGEAAPKIETLFPGTVVDGKVDRAKLASVVTGRPEKLRQLENLIHPLVRRDAERFLNEQRRRGIPMAVLDIPLLFETGGTDRVDRIVVVTAPLEIQRQRVLARPGMTEDRFEDMLSRQMPDAEKRRRADFVIDTSRGLEAARRQVLSIIAQLTGR